MIKLIQLFILVRSSIRAGLNTGLLCPMHLILSDFLAVYPMHDCAWDPCSLW